MKHGPRNATVALIALFILVLAAGAFITGEPNPIAWTRDERGGVVFVWVLFAPLALGFRAALT